MADWMIRETFQDRAGMRSGIAQALCRLQEKTPIGEEGFFDLKVILYELCCNALEHGNAPVELSLCLCCDGCIHALVADAGCGFDPCAMEPSLTPCQERGRGLALVQSLSDSMAYNAAANKVLVRLKLS